MTFTTAEKWGILALGLILLALISVKATMHYWVHPKTDEAAEKRLQARWQQFKKEHEVVADSADADEAELYRKAADSNDEPLPAEVNINTTDSATLVRFKGIGPVTAHKILERRATVGPFTNIDQLRELGRFSDKTFSVLKKHIVVK